MTPKSRPRQRGGTPGAFRAVLFVLALVAALLTGAAALHPSPPAGEELLTESPVPTPVQSAESPLEPEEGAPFAAPVAAFEVRCDVMTCHVDASASSGGDGNIDSFVWDFGDGQQHGDVAGSHTYTAPGIYTITLTVTSDSGAIGVTTEEVTVPLEAAPPVPTVAPGVPTTSPRPGPPVPTESGQPAPTGPQTEVPEPSTTATLTPGPTPSPDGGQSTFGQKAKEIMENCVGGKLVFRPPSPMRQGETEEFTIRVALEDSAVDPGEGLPGEGPVSTREPLVCEQMRAELSSAGMDIERADGGSGVLALTPDGFGEWSWLITARESGTQVLTLRLLAPGPDGSSITFETFTEEIEVQVGVGYMLSNVVKDWASPLGVTIPVVIAAIGSLYLWWRKKSYKPKHGSKEA